MERLELNVDGMMCQHCIMAIKQALKSLSSVKNVEVSLENKKVILEYDKQKNSEKEIRNAIEDQGYSVM